MRLVGVFFCIELDHYILIIELEWHISTYDFKGLDIRIK